MEKHHFTLKHIELKEANEYVERLHRHHPPTWGHRFSLACYEGDRLCGVAIVGRPVARLIDYTKVLEITRLCTDGTYNACSFLYSACKRAAKALGYEKVITYILETESGTSLKASGYQFSHISAGGGGNAKTVKGSIKRQPAKNKCGKRFYKGVNLWLSSMLQPVR